MHLAARLAVLILVGDAQDRQRAVRQSILREFRRCQLCRTGSGRLRTEAGNDKRQHAEYAHRPSSRSGKTSVQRRPPPCLPLCLSDEGSNFNAANRPISAGGIALGAKAGGLTATAAHRVDARLRSGGTLSLAGWRGRSLQAIENLHQGIGAGLHRFIVRALDVDHVAPIVDVEMGCLGRRRRRGRAMTVRTHVGTRAAGSTRTTRTTGAAGAAGATRAIRTERRRTGAVGRTFTGATGSRRRRGRRCRIDHRRRACRGGRRRRWLLREGGTGKSGKSHCG